jgi:peptidoglycan/LPS O-acetylase OafA/YrhL
MNTPAASATKAAAFHIPSLDGIRAASFLMVFVAHAGLDDLVPGGFGVTVFFFLSGYLITTLLRTEWEQSGTVSLKQFYLRRVLRILPPFYLTLLLATVGACLGVVPGAFNGPTLAAQSFHFANYWIVRHGYLGPSGTGIYWSLAVEEHFYLAFPLLFLTLRRRRSSAARQVVVLYAICAAELAWRCVLAYGLHVPTDRTYVATDTRIDSILFGCALAVYGNPVLDGPSRFSETAWKWAFLPIGVGVLLFTFVFRDDEFRETFRYSLQGLALTPLFVTAMRYPRWAPFRVLNTRIASFFGVLSYSLYLVHHVILGVVEAHVALPGVARAVIALALSTALSWTIYQTIEKPCARLRKRLSGAAAGARAKPRGLAAAAGTDGPFPSTGAGS